MKSVPTTDLEELASRFDCFFIDQFGVLHDGLSPYSGAVAALNFLKEKDKTVLLLSNSGKRSAHNIKRIEKLGFNTDSFDHFLTSGEVAWQQLESEHIGKKIPANANCLLLTRDDDLSAIENLQLCPVDDGSNADVVIISGSRGDTMTMEQYKTLLQPAAERGICCLCTNPDKLMLTASGLCFGAGRIAELYQSLGGTVNWIGKPYPAIYQAALALCDHPAAENVCCIGDSIEHDIAGGVGAGCATALVRSGILANETDKKIAGLYDQYKARPDFVLNRFAI